MTTFTINEAKIKLAWREKYLTDGANEQALAHPRGAYRGFWPAPRLVPDTFLRLLVDPYTPGHVVDKDQFLIYRHTDDSTGVGGFCVSIREVGDIEFDCADLFPVGGVAESWYVYVEAAYTPNAATTANYRVMKTDPHNVASPNYEPDAVILAVIPMPVPGAVAFPAFTPLDAIYARRCVPAPTARQQVADFVDGDEPWGLFDGVSRWCLGTGTDGRVFGEPTLDPYTLVAATKFQLSGSFYVGRENAFDVAGQYFVALNALGPALLTGTGRGRIIVSSVVLQSDGITQLNPFADADSEGFYSNPWLQLGFSDCPPDVSYTGNLNVLCFKKKTLLTLENDPASTFPVGCQKVPEHATNVVAKNQAGAPDSLTGVTVTAQLLELLGLVNDRIETIHPTGAPGDWVLLWRSHNITLDANVTKQTSSIYFGDNGLLLLHGAYLKIADGLVYAGGPGGSNAHDVSGVFLRSGASGGLTMGVKTGPVAGSSWDPYNGWTFYTDYNTAQAAIQHAVAPVQPGGGIDWWLAGFGALADMHNRITAGTTCGYPYEVTEEVTVGGAQSRRYFTQRAAYFTHNCSYDSGTSEWTKDDVASPAFMVKINPEGIYFNRRETTSAASWTDAAWSSTWHLGGGETATVGRGAIGFSGDMYEEVHFAMVVEFETIAPAVPDAKAYHQRQGVSWHGRWAVTPTTLTVIVDGQTNWSGGDDWDFFTISNADNWGANIVGTTVSAAWAAANVIHAFGRITVEN